MTKLLAESPDVNTEPDAPPFIASVYVDKFKPPLAVAPWHIKHFCVNNGPIAESQVRTESAAAGVEEVEAATGVSSVEEAGVAEGALVGVKVAVGVAVGIGVGVAVCGT